MTLNCIFVNDVSFWKMIMKWLWTHFDGTKTTIWLYLMLFGQWFWWVKWIQMAYVLISLVHANKQLHGELQTENRWSKELLLVWGTQVTIMVKNHPTDAPNTVVRMWTLKGFFFEPLEETLCTNISSPSLQRIVKKHFYALTLSLAQEFKGHNMYI